MCIYQFKIKYGLQLKCSIASFFCFFVNFSHSFPPLSSFSFSFLLLPSSTATPTQKCPPMCSHTGPCSTQLNVFDTVLYICSSHVRVRYALKRGSEDHERCSSFIYIYNIHIRRITYLCRQMCVLLGPASMFCKILQCFVVQKYNMSS